MSSPVTPKRSPSPHSTATQPATSKLKTNPTSAPPAAEIDMAHNKRSEDDFGVVVGSENSLRGMYESGQLVDVDAGERVYGPEEALNEKVFIWRGDITMLKVDAIVNAANKSLLGGGGVDGAIHSAAGPDLLAECETLGGAQTGETKITKGYDLPSKYVLHTVGPIYSSSRKAECEQRLRSCYEGCLDLAVANGCKTIAFSGISTGIYGYPLDAATQVALDVVRSFLSGPSGASLEGIIFTVFRPIDVAAYRDNVPFFFPSASTSLADATKSAILPSSHAIPTSTASFDPPPSVADSTEVWATALNVPIVTGVDGKAVQAEVPSRTWTPQPEGDTAAKMKMPPPPQDDGGPDSDADPGNWGELKTGKKVQKVGEELLKKVGKE